MNKNSPGSPTSSTPSLPTNYRKTVLPNGIRIVTEEVPTVRSISLGVWIDVGSRDEHEGEDGISHFIEHMVFKGTKNFNIQAIAQSLESVGGYLNAFTGKEHTCFYARSLDEHLPVAVKVIADLVRYPLFERKEIEKEKLVVLEELRNLEDDPDELIHDYLDQNVYWKHPLSHPVIGSADSIKNFTRGELLNYMRRHYLPERVVVSAAGNFRHDTVVNLVQKHLGQHKSHRGIRRRNVGTKVPRLGTQTLKKPINQAHLCMGTLAYGVMNRSRYPMMVMNTLLGEGMSSRLFQSLRERHGLAYSVYSFANTMSDTGNFGVYIGTEEKNIDRSFELIAVEFDKLRSKLVSNAELNRTKSQMKGSVLLSVESMSSRMMRLGSNELYYGEYMPLEDVVKKIEAVTAEDVFAVAEKLLRLEKFSVIHFKPESAPS